MFECYLEVTYRKGKPLAAYFYLPRRARDRSYKCRAVEPGFVVDYNRSGKPIGIEILAPSQVTLATMNRLLHDLGQQPLRRSDFKPLSAA